MNYTLVLAQSDNLICLCVVPGPSSSSAGDDFTLPMIIMGWMVLAVVLFLLRPQSMRGGPAAKPRGPRNVRDSLPVTQSHNLRSCYQRCLILRIMMIIIQLLNCRRY